MSGSNKKKTAAEKPAETHAVKKRTIAECSDKYFVVILWDTGNQYNEEYKRCVLRKSGVSKSVWKTLKTLAAEQLPQYDTATLGEMDEISYCSVGGDDEDESEIQLRKAMDAVFAEVGESEDEEDDETKKKKVRETRANLSVCKLAGIVYVRRDE